LVAREQDVVVADGTGDLGLAFGTIRGQQTGWGQPVVVASLAVGVAAASTLLANIPVVAAMLLLVKGYLVIAGLVPEVALDPTYTQWPAATLPLFVALMFGGTLGGNATLIGAAANVVSVGICAANGRPVTFLGFMRFGVPVVLVQLAVSALYVVGLHLLSR
jgi:Na+/H+ antiporter NhaD/arsenite permease-like protein